MRTTPATYAALAGLMAILWATTACNLPGLPAVRDGGPRDVGVDAGPPGNDTADPPPDGSARVCNPNPAESAYPKCSAAGAIQCVDGGTDTKVVPCGDHEVCQQGKCRPVDNQCDTPLPFRLSKSRLAFQSNGRLRSDSDSVVVENCSNLPIVVEDAAVDFPRANASLANLEVFSITNRFSLDGLRLNPGDTLRVRVEYAPHFGFFTARSAMPSRARPRLALDVQASQSYDLDLPIHRYLHCTSTSPSLEIGEHTRGSATQIEVPVTNCGTVPAVVKLPAPDQVPSSGITLSPVDGCPTGDCPSSCPNRDCPMSQRIAPGATVRFPLEIRAERAGRVAVDLPLLSERAPSADTPPVHGNRYETLSTTLRGRIAPDVCADGGTDSAPGFDYRSVDVEACDDIQTVPWSSGTSTTVAPGQTLHLRPAEAGPKFPDERFHLADRPDRSRSQLGSASCDETRYVHFTPDVPGTYVVAHRQAGDRGQPACKAETFRIEVRPKAPLYVALDWTTERDPIPNDIGYGRGVDLDLHVKADPDDRSTGWTGSRDCFERGAEAGRYCFRGRVRAVSVSGGRTEAIAVDRVDAEAFDLAVRAWNTYRFPGAQATLRVYVGGELLEGFPMTERFVATGSVWHVGRYLPDEQTFEAIDEIRKDFER